MHDQSFSEKNLLRLLIRGDVKEYGLGKTRSEYRAMLKQIASKLNAAEFKFSTLQSSKKSHGQVYTPSCVEDELALRKINDNLKRRFSVRTADRNRIVPQIVTLAKEKGSFHLVKLDIQKFFESIHRESLLQRVLDDPLLSIRTKELLRKLFDLPALQTVKGLPRGLSVSSTLAEHCLQEFDAECRKLPFCYYYVRYVDDMLFFCHENPENISALVESFLPFELSLNPDKFAHIEMTKEGQCVQGIGRTDRLSYLGYEFIFPTSTTNRLKVGIPEKKINKIKTRIVLALVDFTKSKDYSLLLHRIRFLSANFKVAGNKVKGYLFSGIFYNHRYIDETSQESLNDLDLFLRSAVYAKKGTLGRRLSHILTNGQRHELCSNSLCIGHKKPKFRTFTNEQLKDIKKVWAHA